ncbi:MAG: RluA family pseudouridine synthase [Alphaproteobacteria bacterium]|nr:RluA family pseudouridine synthase [Alphaproteobacteria bacterium]
MTEVQFIIVAPKDDDIRLDRWFQRHYPDLKHGMLERLIKNKNIKLNKAKTTAGTHVHTGDEIRIPPLDTPKRQDSPIRLSKKDIQMMQNMVLYKDGAMLILNKPAGLAVQGGSKTTHHIDGMLDALRFESDEKPHLVHRLDKETSGVLVLARSANAAAKLTAAFKGRDVHKVYWAIVAGKPTPVAGKIDAPLTKKTDKVVVDFDHGDRAISVYQTIDNAGQKASWLALSPLTGRTHQLRVHLTDILQTPILGDDKYGKKTLAGIGNGLHLHARAIEIKSPDTHKIVRVIADLPPHMKTTFHMLGFDEKDQKNPFQFLDKESK